MWTLKWTWFLPVCLSCGYAFMLSSLGENVKVLPGKMPCGGHFRVRQSLPQHAQGWLYSRWLWFLFVISLYVILKFRGESDKSKEKNPPCLRASSVRAPPKKNQSAAPNKDYAKTLNQLEIDLVHFLSQVRNLKVALATGSNHRAQDTGDLEDPEDNVTIYEIWGEEEYK